MCDNLCYSDSVRTFGIVSELREPHRKFGTIKCSSTRKVFFHVQNVYGEKVVENSRVCFSEFDGSPHPRAFPVLKAKAAIPQTDQ